MHTFTVEIRESALEPGQWVVHVKPWPYRMRVEQWKTFDSEQEAIAGAPAVLKAALESEESNAA